MKYESNIDDYQYMAGDTTLTGELDKNKKYPKEEMNRKITIEARERFLIQQFLNNMKLYEKTIVYCNNQAHAADVRNLINQVLKNTHIDYCVRVTSAEGERGDNYLKLFRDIDKQRPVILTTSQKLTTGIDACNVRHIVLFRKVNTMIEFKQIIGRGTRLYDKKEYFTIHDFYENCHHFYDPEWDGEPIEPEPQTPREKSTNDKQLEKTEPIKRPIKIEVKLSDGRIQTFRVNQTSLFYGKGGEILSAQEFIQHLFDIMPTFFNNEKHLKEIWTDIGTRTLLLDRLAEEGLSLEILIEVQKIIESENSDVFDVLEYFAYNKTPVPKTKRADVVRRKLYNSLSEEQKEFIEYLLDQYINEGHGIVDITRMPELMKIKYHSFHDGLGYLKIDTKQLESLFFNMQEGLYSPQE